MQGGEARKAQLLRSEKVQHLIQARHDRENERAQELFDKEKQHLQEQAATEQRELREKLGIMREQLGRAGAAAVKASAKGKHLQRRLEEELAAANTHAAVPAVEQVPGLDDEDLHLLRTAVKNEFAKRQQLEREAIDREREKMREEMLAEARRREEERERERETRMCVICLDDVRDTAFACGHQACAGCARDLTTCHICRQTITLRVKLYL
jgi:hypothetical protein